MSPQLKDLIIKLHKKGLCEAEIYKKLQDKKGIDEHIMPHMVFEVLNEYRAAAHYMQKPEGGGCARIFGLIAFLGGSAYLVIRMTVYEHVHLGRRDPGAYALLLAICGLILVFKPHAKLQD